MSSRSTCARHFNTPAHPPATLEDLGETRRLVEKESRRFSPFAPNARDPVYLDDLADSAMRTLWSSTTRSGQGHSILGPGGGGLAGDDDVILVGAWKVTTTFISKMIDAGNDSSITLIASTMGVQPQPGGIAYTAAKHGIIGLMRTLAWEPSPWSIHAHTVSPGVVDTEINHGDNLAPGHERFPRFFTTQRTLPHVDWLSEQNVANVVCFLSSDQAMHTSRALTCL